MSVEYFFARKSLASHETPTQQPPERYEVLYNRQYFSCLPLRAKLSVEACVANHRGGLCLPCLACPAGIKHATAIPNAGSVGKANSADSRSLRGCLGRACLRCGEHHATRLVAGCFCTPCHNRALEVARGQNAKGTWPALAASKLRRIYAVINHDNVEELDEFLASGVGQSKALKIERLESGAIWIEGYLSSREELTTMFERILPGAQVAQYEAKQIHPKKETDVTVRPHAPAREKPVFNDEVLQ